jgi:hypothetical protein
MLRQGKPGQGGLSAYIIRKYLLLVPLAALLLLKMSPRVGYLTHHPGGREFGTISESSQWRRNLEPYVLQKRSIGTIKAVQLRITWDIG